MTPLNGNQRTVLVVDDDPISLAVACLMLESEGYAVLRANSGQAALELIERFDPEQRPDTILIDLQMPGISGSNLAFLIRTTQPQATLVAMSATLPEGVLGFDKLLQKPLDPASLKEALESIEPATAPYQKTAVQEAVLDEKVYAKLERTMPVPALREVYMACVHDTRIRIGNMRIAVNTGELDVVRREAHAVKGGAGMVGAVDMARDAANLESGHYETNELPGLLSNLLYRCEELERILFSKWQS